MTCVTGPKDACIPLIHHLLCTEMHFQRSVLLFGASSFFPDKIPSLFPSATEWNPCTASNPFPGETILPSILADILASGINTHGENMEQICILRGVCALIIRKIRAKGLVLDAPTFLQILDDPMTSASILKESTKRFHTAWNQLSKETKNILGDTLHAWRSSSSPSENVSRWMHSGGLAFFSEDHPIHAAILLRRLLVLKSTERFTPLLFVIFLSRIDSILIAHLLQSPYVRILVWHSQSPTYSFPFHEIRHITTLRKQSVFRYIPTPSSIKGIEFML